MWFKLFSTHWGKREHTRARTHTNSLTLSHTYTNTHSPRPLMTGGNTLASVWISAFRRCRWAPTHKHLEYSRVRTGTVHRVSLLTSGRCSTADPRSPVPPLRQVRHRSSAGGQTRQQPLQLRDSVFPLWHMAHMVNRCRSIPMEFCSIFAMFELKNAGKRCIDKGMDGWVDGGRGGGRERGAVSPPSRPRPRRIIDDMSEGPDSLFPTSYIPLPKSRQVQCSRRKVYFCF